MTAKTHGKHSNTHCWRREDIPPQSGKLAIVTGANGGLGYEIAEALANAGAEVIIAARNPERGHSAAQRIGRDAAGKVRFEALDLADLASVQAFAERVVQQGRPIDLLINNAGLMMPLERRNTADDFELQLGTNHLGHFALTARLLPLLQRGATPRVVTVSSNAHRQGKINFADLQSRQKYRPLAAYAQSKLANLLFAQELQRRSTSGRWGIASIAAHPGMAKTDLMANGPGTGGFLGWMDKLLSPIAGHGAPAGALPILYAAVSPHALPGAYYGPRDMFEMKGPVALAKIAAPALDVAVAARLWTCSEALTDTYY